MNDESESPSLSSVHRSSFIVHRSKEGAVEPLFAAQPFLDFGPDLLHGSATPPVHRIDGPGTAVLRGRVREESPERPGVYAMLDRHGDVIYVGKAKSLRTRLLSYFRVKSRDARAGRILDHTSALV